MGKFIVRFSLGLGSGLELGQCLWLSIVKGLGLDLEYRVRFTVRFMFKVEIMIGDKLMLRVRVTLK